MDDWVDEEISLSEVKERLSVLEPAPIVTTAGHSSSDTYRWQDQPRNDQLERIANSLERIERLLEKATGGHMAG